MSKVKVALSALLVVCSVSMIAAASAAAFEYVVEQKPLVGEEAIEGTSKTSKVEIQLAGSIVGTECTEDKVSGTLKEKGESTFKIEFKGCKVFSISEGGVRENLNKCTVKEPVVAEGTDKLIEHSVDEFTEFKGELVIENCLLSGAYVIEGTQACSTPEATRDTTEHTLTCTPAGGKLKLKSAAAQFFGEESIKLKSKKVWGTTIK